MKMSSLIIPNASAVTASPERSQIPRAPLLPRSRLLILAIFVQMCSLCSSRSLRPYITLVHVWLEHYYETFNPKIMSELPSLVIEIKIVHDKV